MIKSKMKSLLKSVDEGVGQVDSVLMKRMIESGEKALYLQRMAKKQKFTTLNIREYVKS
jgi:hypothetical protein